MPRRGAHIVVVCDDGSTDLTGEIAERIGAIVFAMKIMEVTVRHCRVCLIRRES